MKFVHLAPQPSIPRIAKNGIRLGDGRRGRGVYAVPLVMLGQASLSIDEQVLESEPGSTGTLWKWLKNLEHRHRNCAAVVFEPNSTCWPANLYVTVESNVGTSWVDNIGKGGIKVTADDLTFVRSANNQGLCADLSVEVSEVSALGLIMHELQIAGFRTWSNYDESIEIVFRSPISPNSIRRIVPLYRSNLEFKKDRERQWNAG